MSYDLMKCENKNPVCVDGVDIVNMYGIDVEQELIEVISSEIIKELNGSFDADKRDSFKT